MIKATGNLRNVDIPCALFWHRNVGSLRLYPKLVRHVAAPHDHLSWSWWAYHSCTLDILQRWIASFNRARWPRQRSFRSTLIPTQGPPQPNWTYCRCIHPSSTFASIGRLIHFKDGDRFRWSYPQIRAWASVTTLASHVDHGQCNALRTELTSVFLVPDQHLLSLFKLINSRLATPWKIIIIAFLSQLNVILCCQHAFIFSQNFRRCVSL